jgi:hypothetical protein
MSPNRKSLEWIAGREPPETVITGGPAQCWPLDNDELIRLRATRGRSKEMDADWIATDRALHYLRYRVGRAETWVWGSVEGAEVIRRHWFKCDVRVSLVDGALYVVTVSKPDARALPAIVAERASARTNPE